jgi:hypothetical protein
MVDDGGVKIYHGGSWWTMVGLIFIMVDDGGVKIYHGG